MPRVKTKESEPKSFRLSKEVCKMLEDYSDQSMIPMTRIVEKAIEEYISIHSKGDEHA